mmetsp:Transcript_101270/g.179943  ORF Transcript_101270/g.179943 Transcript_101270/m.179943 type:complete len:211 (+) Transcript_101270:330-962(+)
MIDDVVAIVEDTTVVAKPVVCCHGYSHWTLLSHGLCQWKLLIARQHAESSEAQGVAAILCSAELHEGIFLATAAIFRAVRHFPFLADAVLHGPAQGQLHGGSCTAALSTALLGVWNAVHQLLAGEGLGFTAVNLRMSIQGRGRCNCPARAACALLGNNLAIPQFSPVYFLRQRGLDPHVVFLLGGKRQSFSACPGGLVAVHCIQLLLLVI